jgi:hypothetical protein
MFTTFYCQKKQYQILSNMRLIKWEVILEFINAFYVDVRGRPWGTKLRCGVNRFRRFSAPAHPAPIALWSFDDDT